MRFTIGHFTIPIVVFFFSFLPILKCSFFTPRITLNIRFKKERFTIGIVKRSVPEEMGEIDTISSQKIHFLLHNIQLECRKIHFL
jgi:hypothetical protein